MIRHSQIDIPPNNGYIAC